MTLELTDKNFAAETEKGVVLVDFWATWCGPCKMQAPIIDAIAEEYEGRAKIAKLEVDENPDTPQQFGVMSIPTMIIKKDGEVVEKITGVHQKPQLEALLNKYV